MLLLVKIKRLIKKKHKNDKHRYVHSLGVAKINVNTECQQEWTRLVRETLENNKEVYDPRKIIGPGMKGIEAVVDYKVKVFGSENKA